MSKAELSPERIKLAVSMVEAGKDTIAMTMIAMGVKMISEGQTMVGGFLITVGWILLLIDRLRGT